MGMLVQWNIRSCFITPYISLCFSHVVACLTTSSPNEMSRNIDPLFVFRWNEQLYRKYWRIICHFSWGSKCILSSCSPQPGHLFLLWQLFCIPFHILPGLLSDFCTSKWQSILVAKSVHCVQIKKQQAQTLLVCFWINSDHPDPSLWQTHLIFCSCFHQLCGNIYSDLPCHRTSSELDLCGLIFPHFQL